MSREWTDMMRSRWQRSIQELPRHQRCVAELYEAARLLMDQPEFRYASYVLQEEAKRLSAANRDRLSEAVELKDCLP